MSRILVAGVGNLFFSDDGFGVEVARRLGNAPPLDATVAEFGIRALHLAHELLVPTEQLIIIACLARGGPPGTIYVLEPGDDGAVGAIADIHNMNLPVLFAAVRDLGGRMPQTVVVGCEPAVTDPGVGLSALVERAVAPAVDLIYDLVISYRAPAYALPA